MSTMNQLCFLVFHLQEIDPSIADAAVAIPGGRSEDSLVTISLSKNKGNDVTHDTFASKRSSQRGERKTQSSHQKQNSLYTYKPLP
jgi:hypothetical protein